MKHFAAQSLISLAHVYTCMQVMKAGIEATEVVPGRTEYIDLQQNFQVLVDSANTPEALSRLLEDVKIANARRILLVFGCEGEEDVSKRPYMGEIAHYKVNVTVRHGRLQLLCFCMLLALLQESTARCQDGCEGTLHCDCIFDILAPAATGNGDCERFSFCVPQLASFLYAKSSLAVSIALTDNCSHQCICSSGNVVVVVQADSVFITNHNQRSKAPDQIVRDIISGFPDEILDKNANKPWAGGFLQDPHRVSSTVREFLWEGQNM